MKRFWIVYIPLVVLSSMAVWFAAPVARPYMSRFHKKDKAVAQEEPDSILKSGKAISVGEYKQSFDAAADDQSSGTAVNDGSSSFEDPPALLGIFRVTSWNKEKPTWGVVCQKTNFYDSEGKRLGEIPGSIIFDYIESRKSSKGVMVLCKFKYKGKEHGPYLVKHTDVALFTGKYTDLSENQRKYLEAYYKTRDLMEERKIEVMHEMAIKNPFYVQYKSAYDKYMDHIEAAKELTAQRDSSTGLKRSRLDDQLRRMKNQETELKQDYDTIHAKYKAWKQQNASDLPDSEIDPKVNGHRMEMRRLARLIPGLAY